MPTMTWQCLEDAAHHVQGFLLAHGSLVAVVQTTLLATLMASIDGVAAIVTVEPPEEL